jgi:hypothetical protein
MALIGVSVGETFEYVLDRDPCKKRVQLEVPLVENGVKITEEVVIGDGATVFALGVLDVFVMGMIYDETSSVTRGEDAGRVGITTRINQSNIEAVRFGLKGWRNFKDARGNDLAFKTVKKLTNGRTYTVVSDECLERLGIRDIRELAQAIKDRSEVGREEEKNSATA